jgi:ribosome-binding factor A
MGKKRTREREVGDGGRAVRLQELIREELSFLLRGEIRDPALADVEISMVELTGECARVWFFGGEGAAPSLERAAGFMRSRLAESLGLKRTPDLRFRRDPTTRALTPDAPSRDER